MSRRKQVALPGVERVKRKRRVMMLIANAGPGDGGRAQIYGCCKCGGGKLVMGGPAKARIPCPTCNQEASE